MRVGWVFDDLFLEHDTGPAHPERADRLRYIIEALTKEGLLAKMEALRFSPATTEQLLGIHEPEYIALLREACRSGLLYIGSPDTPICPKSYDAALLAAGGVIAACDAAMTDGPRRSFCAVRPPGHHAERDLAMGFCLLNNVAIGADHLIKRDGLERVAILDFDVHHGNGTQNAFEGRADVLYVSIHEHPAHLVPGTGYESEMGHGKGRGFTVNVPMMPYSGDVEYRHAFAEQIMPRLYEYRPQFLLVSAGFDAVREDPLAQIELESSSYGWITRDLVALAESCCEGRLVSVLEGGYEEHSLKRSVVEHVRAMMESE